MRQKNLQSPEGARGTEPLAVASGQTARRPACYRKRFRTSSVARSRGLEFILSFDPQAYARGYTLPLAYAGSLSAFGLREFVGASVVNAISRPAARVFLPS
jgi:hypothetical protein